MLQLFGRIALRAYTVSMASSIRLRFALNWLSYIALSIVAIVVAWWLYGKPAQATLRDFKDLATLSVATGTLIGTMMILAFTLSMIPVQRTVENFTASITQLYRQDFVSQLIFGVLAVFTLLSFVAALYAKLVTRIIPLEVLALAVSLDLLWWYHRHAIRLLGSSAAIDRFLRQIRRDIDRVQRTVSRLAWIKWRTLSAADRTLEARAKLEAVFNGAAGNQILHARLSELAEVGQRAVARGETATVRMCVGAIGTVIIQYMDQRARNLQPVAKALLVVGTDADESFIVTYEHLSDINRTCVTKGDEVASIYVVRTFAAIAIHAANLKLAFFPGDRAPLVAMPLHYLLTCAEQSQAAGLTNVSLEASSLFANISERAPVNVGTSDVVAPAIEALSKLASGLFAAGLPTRMSYLANEPVKAIMAILRHVVDRKIAEARLMVRTVAGKFQMLVPVAVQYERSTPGVLLPGSLPLSPPYDLLEGNSFGYLLERGAGMIAASDILTNPYGDFIELSNAVSEHFRRLAEQANLGASFLAWHITQTIKYIAHIYLNLLSRPLTDDDRHLKELLRSFLWHLPFFWMIFSKPSAADYSRAEDATDALAWVGMSFFEAGHPGVAHDAADHIASIANSFASTEGLNEYQIADLLMPIWHIRILAEARQDSATVEKVDEKMGKPAPLPDERWPAVAQALELRKRQLAEELEAPHMIGDDAFVLLARLLRRR